ncbi:hypothetical protein HAPAU_38250 [Halalkalicoccus paucihalophilus]|uniref:Uncharacterized protein n=1 Tax=Halalkalicoccus paucihalophilus TaxID=1008153 RepID=A0A151A925_9EURY|nr:hypothetical protein [Halalkalicoccus paucihalophilus]KYH24181.1 hypothetical protein HAPAU_38250 [Halalkalicoccus paucihalophilus]
MSEKEGQEVETEKTKAVAECDQCGTYTPVRVWSDGTIHPVGGDEFCCEEQSYTVLENDAFSEAEREQ